jgi:hypothetical protein
MSEMPEKIWVDIDSESGESDWFDDETEDCQMYIRGDLSATGGPPKKWPELHVRPIMYGYPQDKTPWAWEVSRYISDPGIRITSSTKYKTAQTAKQAARKWLKDHGLEEVTE